MSVLFIYFWLCWVFVSVQGLSLVVASGGHSSSRCAGLSPSRPLLLRSTGFRRAGSVVVAHGLSCSVACGIFPDQDSNPCPLHWQADSQPLCHQGSPVLKFLIIFDKDSYIFILPCSHAWLYFLCSFILWCNFNFFYPTRDKPIRIFSFFSFWKLIENLVFLGLYREVLRVLFWCFSSMVIHLERLK